MDSAVLTLNGGGGGGTYRNCSMAHRLMRGTLVGTGNNLSVSPLVTTTYYGRLCRMQLLVAFTTICQAVTVTVNPAPTAVAGTDVITCSNSTPVNITAGSSATNNGGVTWTSSGTGTFTNATSLTLATYAPSAADITAGTVTLP